MTLSRRGQRTRLAIYTHFASGGRLPTHDALARQLDLSQQDYETALDELASTHHVVLEDGEVVMAHPFSTRSFGFSVMGPRTLWWGGCAWDSFAIPNLVPDSPQVLVATACPACATPHAWTVTNQAPPDGDQVAHFLVPITRAWSDVINTCSNQRIFCSEHCVDEWLARSGNERGYVMSLETLWRLAEHWYDGRLDTPYLRRDPATAADYFRSVGLRGPFWGLDAKDAE